MSLDWAEEEDGEEDMSPEIELV